MFAYARGFCHKCGATGLVPRFGTLLFDRRGNQPQRPWGPDEDGRPRQPDASQKFSERELALIASRENPAEQLNKPPPGRV